MVEKWLAEFNNKLFILIFLGKIVYIPMLILENMGQVLVQEKSHTHLGLCFQSDALWTSHIHTIHDKATKRFNILRMLKDKVNRKTLVKVNIVS